MSFLTWPIRLFLFWYPHAVIVFLRILKNSIQLLEEELGVGVMARLIFTPMFHDRSFVGRLVSFAFRLTRIFMGLIAYIMAALIILALAAIWFTLPLLLPYLIAVPVDGFSLVQEEIVYVLFGVLIFGLALFTSHLIHRPLKKVRQLKDASQIWKSTNLSLKNITWDYLIKTHEVEQLLQSLEVTIDKLPKIEITINDELEKTIYQIAKDCQALYITPGYFFVAAITLAPSIANDLLKTNLITKDFEEALKFWEYKRNHWRVVYLWDDDFGVKHLAGVNRGWLGAPTPSLDAISTDLTKYAGRRSANFIGRENLVEDVINVLSQEKQRNIILVGPPGTGKTTLVNSLAQRILSGDAPASIANKRIVAMDLTKLMSAASGEGDLAAKIKSAFEEIQYVEDIIVYIDEIHNLGVGEAGASYNLYSLMLPYLESDDFQFIGSTEPENYARILEKNGSFLRLFHKIDLPPASRDETIHIVEEQAIEYGKNKKITITYLAVKELVEKAARLIHDRVLPDSAISLLEECEVVSKDDGVISKADVDAALTKRVNVPIVDLDNSQKETLLKLEDIIHQKMIDQVEAVRGVATVLRRAAASLRDQNRPIGSFLFVGPTGVGKTELAKTLAEVYFKNAGAFIRFDMSEYQNQDSVNRLIGTPDMPGELTETIQNKPYALLLLDEFEKAHPQLLTLFLQVLDDGRLTDGSGKTIDFTNTIIIATSNAGSMTIVNGLQKGLTIEQLDQPVRNELLKVYKPELVNRFDEVVIFKPLSQTDLEQIVKLKLIGLQTMLKEQGYLVNFDQTLVSALAQKGFDPVLGARPLRRLIQDTLEAKLSVMILEGQLPKGETYTLPASVLN